MGAQCSGGHKPRYWMEFVGVNEEGQLFSLKHVGLRSGNAAKSLAGIEYAVDEVLTDLDDEHCWDIGGRSPIRPLTDKFCVLGDGLVYMIDCSDKDDIDTELDRLDCHVLTNESTQDTVLMILAFKQDVEGALSLEKIENRVREKISGHETTLGGRVLFVKGCDSETKAGLKEAFSQLVQAVTEKKNGKLTPGFHTFPDDDNENKTQFHFLKKMFNLSHMKSVLLY